MLLFVGDNEVGYWLEEIQYSKPETIKYTGSYSHIADVVDVVLSQECNAIIFDIQNFIDKSSVIVDNVVKIKQATGATIIIYAPGYLLGSDILTECIGAGFKNIITATNLADIKKECINGINSLNDNVDFDVLKENEERNRITLVNPKKIVKNYKTIGVVGSQSRIGTTTQAIQIVKYLQFKGFKACYIEMNNNDYVVNLKRLYSDATSDINIGKTTYAGIDMFYKHEKINEILQLDYDFFVYDFGDISKTNIVSFLEKDYTILVAGVKPNEMQYSNIAVSKVLESNTDYIFSFTAENEKEDIKEMMQGAGEHTFFANTVTDYFTLLTNAVRLYDDIFCFENKETGEKKKKGLKSLFKR